MRITIINRRVIWLIEQPVKKIVRRTFVKTISETKVVNGKTVTETKTEQWADTPEVDDNLWKEMDKALDAVGKILDKVGKQK